MKYENRGKIEYRERARQIIDFSGLRYGNITPTDVDGCIEYQNKCILFLEYKYDDAKMPRGQELAFERIVDDIQNGGKECALMVCSHNVQNCEKDIDAATAKVVRLYWHGRWYDYQEKKTVKERVDNYLEWVDKGCPPF
jgi:hypothetical protein